MLSSYMKKPRKKPKTVLFQMRMPRDLRDAAKVMSKADGDSGISNFVRRLIAVEKQRRAQLGDQGVAK